MSKKSTKALASAALMSLVLTTALSAGPVKAAQGKVTRTSGTTRYATAAEVAKTNWAQGSKNVVLVSGEGYADAVSASALAKKLDAPILLTASDTLSSDAKSALDTLKPENVYVIGGNASISQNIRDGLKADKYNLTELGGTTRYETNAKVADELVKLGVDPSNVMVVGGEGFSDALSVAPVAAAKGQILLLASNDQSATQPVIDFVKANNSKATVVGTKNVINDTIYDALGAASRVDGGTSRFDTNLKVLDAFKDSLKTDKVYIANASAADPDNLYADALVASAVAGKYSAPLVLVDKDGSEGTTNALAYLKNNTDSSTDVQLIGGTAVVPQSIEDDINALYNPQDQDQATAVDSVEASGLNQIKVTFNGKVDEDTAKDVSNYEVDGSQLKKDGASASLQDDNKTVLINLSKVEDQNSDIDVKVRKGILSEDKSNTIPEYTKTVTFSDTTAPTLNSVEARGNNKLDIKFSEPIKVQAHDEASALTKIAGKLKINDNNLSSYGINTEVADDALKYSALDDAVVTKDDNDNMYYYTDEVEVYFDSALPTGSNTLKLSNADSSILSDAAGFPIADTTQNFTVDDVTGAPQITSITAEDSGKVYINFDRPMDTKTAKENANYVLNGEGDSTAGNISDATIDLKKDDTQVKISGVDLNKNSNKIYISNKVEDAYGNKVADDTYKSFDLEEDTTKPKVTSVSALDESTIRVRFSKDVDASYAKSKSNYKLLDGNGNDITNEINPNDIAIVDGKDSDKTASVFDIKLGEDSEKNQYKLTDSKYTITIKNIQDTASTPNVMEDYTTTFDGSGDVNAQVTGVYNAGKDEDGKYKVALVFNKEMDSTSLGDTSSYQYINAKGDTKPLPSGADITVSSDNKSVVIKLPTSLTTDVTDTNVDTANIVKAIYATDVKDTDGNTLGVGNNGGDIKQNTERSTVKDKSIKIYYNGDDLKADVDFTNAIDTDTLKASDFKLAGETADSASAKGSKVTLTFDNDKDGESTREDKSDPTTKINKIKAQGPNAPLTVVGTTSGSGTDTVHNTNTKDITGASIAINNNDNYDGKESARPYFYDAAPKTIVTKDDKGNASNWNAYVDSDTNPTTANVDVVFDTPIDVNSVKSSDFKFTVNNTTVNAYKAEVMTDKDGNPTSTVKFIFNNNGDSNFTDAFKKVSTIKVTPEEVKDISTVRDGNDEYAYYTPSGDDLKGITVTIGIGDSNIKIDSTKLSGTTIKGSDITVPKGTTLTNFKAGITPTNGSYKIYAKDGDTTEATDLKGGYILTFTPKDTSKEAVNYTINFQE